MAGLTISSDGTKIEGVPPDYLAMKDTKLMSQADIKRRDAWQASFGKALNATYQKIFNNIDFSCSPGEQAALTESILADFNGSRDKATGLTNWLGGGGIYKGFWGDKPCWAKSTDYLEANKIVTEGTQTPHNIAELLKTLKAVNPSAHSYVVYKAYAKAKRVKGSNDKQYNDIDNPNVKKALEAGAKLGDSIAGIPKVVFDAATATVDTAKSTVENASWLVSNWWVIPLGLTVVIGGVGYVVYRNRKGLIEIAGTAAQFTPAGRAAGIMNAVAKNPRKLPKF